ncbi:MAG: AraC family transcriptional regulator [Candidatus Aminicenantes bacterium]|nr:AraC family transcriptional regulator [Candidatus Aminicenantes bacterium]
MSLDIRLILNIITAFLLIFFSLFLLTRRGQNRYSNILLAGFLIINAVPFILTIFSILEIKLFVNLPTLFLSLFTLDFLMGPIIFFYTKSLAFRDFTFRKKDWIHLLPVIVFHFYLLFSIILKQFGSAPPRFTYWEITTTLIVSHMVLVIYAIKSVKVLKQFTISIKNTFSFTEKINLNWLRFVLIGFGMIWLMIITNCLVRIIWRTPIPYLNDSITGANFLVSTIIIYYGLTQPKLFSSNEEKSKYLRSTLNHKDAQLYINRLKEFMETEKPHLIPSLTINHLSEKLEIHPKHLSQLINEKYQQNFFDFINSYRIEEAKRYLSKRSRNNFNISQVLYEVGFNSKATFNRAFTKHVGMTPREYKKQSGMKVQAQH